MDKEHLKKINEKTPIRIITTGGTIEKTYDEEDGLFINRNSTIRDKILNKLRLPYTKLIVETVMSKDSLDMSEGDRRILCEAVKKAMESLHPIVVLHGTDTLHLSAFLCYQEIPAPSVPVIFTGAMRPLGWEDSDAWQNITEALFACKILYPGLYLSFHNRLFPVPHFQKNRKEKTFEATE